ncbi:tyrosine-type recombinase/integrase [Tahibacter harae]|uniref:Tyrosine-type recombinase/integrase n=1 Tax=Tahibacter harae TaxID=2963937 RepID=A0ABT1QQY1_9GAMM|nr:integrase arm-type DNA-binding domain-containing protein [Tahibacter harae]MCQ4164678.1 tyrosine-type recombinase/integrase [Tahibacter harae]
MPLTDTEARKTPPSDRPQKLFDGGGLYLLINPNGTRWWRLKYRVAGSEKLLSLGVYPEVSLKAARERREELRRQLKAGIDPGQQRRAEKLSQAGAVADTFEAIANEWLELQKKRLAPATHSKCRWMLDGYLIPAFGRLPMGDVTPPMILAALRLIESKGAHETAHRCRAFCGRIFRYAIATSRAERDPSADLRGALAPVVHTPRAAITDPERIGDLLRAIDGYEGHYPTLYALRLAPLVFTRPGELRCAEWAEIDLDGAEWVIPGRRMKMRQEHIVPLSTQAVEILRAAHKVSSNSRFVFPGVRNRAEPLSNNTINAALRRLGYPKDEMTGHGFRALASTRLNEMGWAPDVIERQLAHAEANRVRAVYNRAQYLPERRKMMQAWADYLDGLRRP